MIIGIGLGIFLVTLVIGIATRNSRLSTLSVLGILMLIAARLLLPEMP